MSFAEPESILAQARESRLQSELEMLKQEQLSLTVRERLLKAQQELLSRQVNDATTTLDALERVLHQRLTTEAERVGSLVHTIPQDIPADDKAAQALVAEVAGALRVRAPLHTPKPPR